MEYGIVRVDADNYYPLFGEMVYRRGHAGADPAEPLQPDPEVLRELGDRNLRVYAAQAEGRFVGWISLVYMPKVSRFGGHGHVYVDELWVEPEHRRQGIARALMATADEMARERDAVGVRLYVNTQNPGARRLYDECGYAPDGTATFMEKPCR